MRCGLDGSKVEGFYICMQAFMGDLYECLRGAMNTLPIDDWGSFKAQ